MTEGRDDSKIISLKDLKDESLGYVAEVLGEEYALLERDHEIMEPKNFIAEQRHLDLLEGVALGIELMGNGVPVEQQIDLRDPIITVFHRMSVNRKIEELSKTPISKKARELKDKNIIEEEKNIDKNVSKIEQALTNESLVEKINSLIAQVDIAIAIGLLNKKTTDPKAYSLRFGALSTARQTYTSVWEILIGIKGERSLILPDATSLHLYEEKPSKAMEDIAHRYLEMLPEVKDNSENI